MLVHGERYTLFDWTDGCMAHPCFELTTIIDPVFEDRVLPHDTPGRTPLREASLEPWTAYEPRERLVEVFEVSRPLGALHPAMRDMWIRRHVAEDARGEWERGVGDVVQACAPVPAAGGLKTI